MLLPNSNPVATVKSRFVRVIFAYCHAYELSVKHGTQNLIWHDLTSHAVPIYIVFDTTNKEFQLFSFAKHKAVINFVALKAALKLSSMSKKFIVTETSDHTYGFGFVHAYDAEEFLNQLNWLNGKIREHVMTQDSLKLENDLHADSPIAKVQHGLQDVQHGFAKLNLMPGFPDMVQVVDFSNNIKKSNIVCSSNNNYNYTLPKIPTKFDFDLPISSSDTVPTFIHGEKQFDKESSICNIPKIMDRSSALNFESTNDSHSVKHVHFEDDELQKLISLPPKTHTFTNPTSGVSVAKCEEEKAHSASWSPFEMLDLNFLHNAFYENGLDNFDNLNEQENVTPTADSIPSSGAELLKS